jgi:hypothetical protein
VKTREPSNSKEDNSSIEPQVHAGARPEHQTATNLLQTCMLLMKVRGFHTTKTHLRRESKFCISRAREIGYIFVQLPLKRDVPTSSRGAGSRRAVGGHRNL